jgi:hypothetical protein
MFPMSQTTRQVGYCVLAFLLIAVAILAPFIWPPGLSSLYNTNFWLMVSGFIYCCFVLWYLFYQRGGSTRTVQFTLGIALIFFSAILNMSIESVQLNNSNNKEIFSQNHPQALRIINMIVNWTKDVVAFGIAALAANLAADAIVKR